MKKLPPLIKLALDAVEELKAQDIKLLDVTKLTPVTDYMLICTGTSTRHVKAIAENVALRAKQYGHPARGVAGEAQSEWVLVDLGDIIVHAMQVQARAFYQLEKLWDMREFASESKPKPKNKSKGKPKSKPKNKPKSKTPSSKKKAKPVKKKPQKNTKKKTKKKKKLTTKKATHTNKKKKKTTKKFAAQETLCIQ